MYQGIGAHAGDPSELAAITEAVAGKENLAEDVCALAAKAIELAALLPRVRAKQAQRDAAAADGAAAANPRRAPTAALTSLSASFSACAGAQDRKTRPPVIDFVAPSCGMQSAVVITHLLGVLV